MTQEALEQLQALGFGDYEAKAYVSLLQRGPLTGYQLARASGIPRPNIYPVLDRLQQRGIVSKLEVEGGAHYVALPAEEMLSRLGRETRDRMDRARDAMRGLEDAPGTRPVWNLKGYDVVQGRAQEVVDGAQEKLLIGIWSDESLRLADHNDRAKSRGVDITTLCIQGCPHECGGCRGDVYRYPLAAPTDARWLVIAADDRELLVGQMSPDREAVAAVTGLPVLVAIGSHYLRNAIAAAEIVRSLGPRGRKLLDRQALRALESAGLASGGQTWLEGMMKVAGTRS